jgi:hypothetical protein
MRPTRAQSDEAFRAAGLEMVDFQVECMFLVFALSACGNLYAYDGSHGCGQQFALESRAR